MKNINKFYKYFFALFILMACDEELRDLSFTDSIAPPSNVSAAYDLTQDNTGNVTITPSADGAVSFEVYFGDSTTEPAKLGLGENVTHTYAEGSYNVKIVAINLKGEKVEATQPLVVSFRAPENLMVTIENDAVISKQVNVTATADFAATYEFHSGETGVTQPVATANIGDQLSYQYSTPGTYSVKIVAKGAAIATTEYTMDFEVTEILAPIASAPAPPARGAADVISIYSSVYTDVAETNYFPDWGQGGQGSSWAEFDLNGDKMLQYINLSYQGIALKDGTSVDVSNMEYLHLDVWTSVNGDITDLETSLINNTAGGATEAPVTKSITAGDWTSIDIPIKDYTDQGLTVSEIFQLKFVGTPWAAGTVFIDNIYFYKSPSVPFNGVTPLTFEDNFTLSSFDGGAIQAIANPDASGINTSSRVFEMVKNAGQPWAGSKITLNENFDVSNPIVKAKVWAPRTGLNLLLKFEDATPWPNTAASAEITATTTVANQWEELTFDFTGISGAIDFNNLVLIMDNGTQGDGTSDYTIYVDDITTSPELNLEPNVSLSSFDGGDITIIDNPDASGTNTSARVAKMVKNAGQPWAGSKITVNSPFSFIGGTGVKVKVWSPRAGLNLLLKFEDATPWPNTVASAEVTATTTVANGWEELTFSFSGISTSVDFNNLVLIMDNGTQGDGSSNYTIYIDDITQF
ncbi:hypothetical protein [Polaribacter marinivivus]|uniref:PKD/Chitinase domain-containing protein n=1 Tax=Polaribacter marinivivus TaxID=1524260 RepID=A0ABV8REB5_9FLAO|nr:hypothetical protein [uncultured Polaribacter sp.]